MRVRLFHIVWLLAAIHIISCNEVRYEECSFLNTVQNYQDSVDLVSINKANIENPITLNSANLNCENEVDIIEVIDTTTFILDTYLNMFDKLRRDPNLNYGYFFIDNFLEGNPYIYVLKKDYTIKDYINKKKSTKIFHTQDDFEFFFYSTMKNFLETKSNRAKYHIFPEETPEGYLQYLFFHEIGELFALMWHSSYDSREVICSKENLNRIIWEFKHDQWSDIFPKDIIILRSLDPTPIIKFNRRNYKITWYEIEYWSGIYERTYTIKRSSPHEVNKIKEEKVARIKNNLIL